LQFLPRLLVVAKSDIGDGTNAAAMDASKVTESTNVEKITTRHLVLLHPPDGILL
jgi:hypothetical protein